VGEQVADGDGPLEAREFRLIASAGIDDLEVAQFGNVIGGGVVQAETAFFEQDQRRHAGDDFGHRVNAKDGVGRHRRAGFEVAVTERGEIGDFAFARDERNGAGVLVVVDVLLDHCAHPVEAFRVEAEGFGVFTREGLGKGGKRREENR